MVLQMLPSKLLFFSPQSFILLLLPLCIFFFISTEGPSLRWPGHKELDLSQCTHHMPKRPTANSTLAGDLIDDASEGAFRISQVTMHFGENRDRTIERSLKTHIEHGEKWGYPIHILRNTIVGMEDGRDKVYNKLFWLTSIMANEMAKPFGRRSDWLVCVPTLCSFDVQLLLVPSQGLNATQQQMADY